MTTDRWTSGDSDLTDALRTLYAAPTDDGYWDALEARILVHVARGDEGASVWYAELADMMRPGLLAAAALILAASLAMVQSRQADARRAYASVIRPAAASAEPSRGASVGDGDAAIHFILSH